MSQLGITMSDKTESPADGGSSGGKRKRSKWVTITIVGILLALIAAAAVAAVSFMGEDESPDYSGEGTGSTTYSVKQGVTLSEVGRDLKAKDIVASVTAFVNAANAASDKSMQPGTYRMRFQMSGAAAFDALTNRANLVGQISIPEGIRATKVAAIAAKATGKPVEDYLKVVKNPSELVLPAYANGNVEGFLYPSTYDVVPNETPTQVLQHMVDQYVKVADSLDLQNKAATVKKTPYEVLTIASLIQAEAAPADFGKVSRVIYNRLACDPYCPNKEWINGRLDFDSTLNYAANTSSLDGVDRAADTPYNTYLHSGLPPTPINNPGKAAIEAALNPDEGDWLWFISDAGLDMHIFSTNKNDHDAANQKRQAALREQQQGN